MTRIEQFRDRKRKYLRRRNRGLRAGYRRFGNKGYPWPGEPRRPAWVQEFTAEVQGGEGIVDGHVLNATFVPLALLRLGGYVTGGGRGNPPVSHQFPSGPPVPPIHEHPRQEAIGMQSRRAMYCGKKVTKLNGAQRVAWYAHIYYIRHGAYPFWEPTGLTPRENP